MGPFEGPRSLKWILLPFILGLMLSIGTGLTSTPKSLDPPTFFTSDGRPIKPSPAGRALMDTQVSKLDSSETVSLFYPALNSAHLNPPKITDGNGGAMTPSEIAFHVRPLHGYASSWGLEVQPEDPRLQLSRSKFGKWQVHMPTEIAQLGRPLEIAVFARSPADTALGPQLLTLQLMPLILKRTGNLIRVTSNLVQGNIHTSNKISLLWLQSLGILI